MNNTQYLLIKLAEECAEVAQMALKCSHFGLEEQQDGNTSSNRHRLHGELNDVMAQIKMLNDEVGFDFVVSQASVDVKILKVKRYRNYSIDLGEVIL